MANFLKSLFVKGIEIDPAGATSAQVLSYNGTKFVPTTAGVGALGLDDLSDVVITTPATTQFVRYNGTNWVNTTISAGDVPTLNQNTTGSAAVWTTSRTITLAGDLTGNVLINGSADVTLTATIAADSVALGTDTTGNYMSGVTAGTGISVTHTPSEGSSATIAVDATYNRLVPSGSIITWGGSSASPPSGYLTCDGTTVSRTTYAALYAVIGDRYGAGDGSTTFTLPNFASGLIPFSTTTLNASPGTGTRQTQTVNTANTASSGHAHTFSSTTSGNQSADHTHGISSQATGNASVDHSHAQNAVNTGNVSADHSHSGNTGTESANHSHVYFKGNSGANANSGNISANHSHGFTTGGISANHFHTTNASNTGGHSVTHTHNFSGNTAGMSVSHTHANTAAVSSTTADTAHLHTITGTYVVYLIKT
jgi:microcystin-dependent protein